MVNDTKDEFARVKLTINIPFDKPNRNGMVLTKEAVEKAVKNLHDNLPIVYKNKSKDVTEVIGYTDEESRIAIWDFENQVCKLITDGVVFNCGVEILMNEIIDSKISNFKIIGVGLTSQK